MFSFSNAMPTVPPNKLLADRDMAWCEVKFPWFNWTLHACATPNTYTLMGVPIEQNKWIEKPSVLMYVRRMTHDRGHVYNIGISDDRRETHRQEEDLEYAVKKFLELFTQNFVLDKRVLHFVQLPNIYPYLFRMPLTMPPLEKLRYFFPTLQWEARGTQGMYQEDLDPFESYYGCLPHEDGDFSPAIDVEHYTFGDSKRDSFFMNILMNGAMQGDFDSGQSMFPEVDPIVSLAGEAKAYLARKLQALAIML